MALVTPWVVSPRGPARNRVGRPPDGFAASAPLGLRVGRGVTSTRRRSDDQCRVVPGRALPGNAGRDGADSGASSGTDTPAGHADIPCLPRHSAPEPPPGQTGLTATTEVCSGADPRSTPPPGVESHHIARLGAAHKASRDVGAAGRCPAGAVLGRWVGVRDLGVRWSPRGTATYRADVRSFIATNPRAFLLGAFGYPQALQVAPGSYPQALVGSPWTSHSGAMSNWWSGFTDVVVPAKCAGCERRGGVLCDRCRVPLTKDTAHRVRPVPTPAALPEVYAVAGYWGSTRAALIAHKERGVLALARPLGTALAVAVRVALQSRPQRTGRAGARPTLLVPVPSARRSIHARGHDPTLRIALAAAKELRRGGLPIRVVRLLRQCRDVADQAELSAQQRWANLSGALVARAGWLRRDGPEVVLADDLLTTGASLAEASRAVTAAGGQVAGAAVVASPCLVGRSVFKTMNGRRNESG